MYLSINIYLYNFIYVYPSFDAPIFLQEKKNCTKFRIKLRALSKESLAPPRLSLIVSYPLPIFIRISFFLLFFFGYNGNPEEGSEGGGEGAW